MNEDIDYDQPDYDLLIVGGGLVGASLAAALADTLARVAVIEPFAATCRQQPSYDERTVALTYHTRQIYSAMGLWQPIATAGVEPIIDIHISNRGHCGMTHLSHKDIGTAALGYVVPTRTIGQVLHARIQTAANIDFYCPATAIDYQANNARSWVTIKNGEHTLRRNAKLVVLADGGNSNLTAAWQPARQQYSQQALSTIVGCDRPHNGRAYERFTNEGPIALLPHSDQRYAVVWTCSAAFVAARATLPDDAFIDALQNAFGDRAGTLFSPTPRNVYPLQRSSMANPSGQRVVAIGNAAHSVHPVAGQGFNLGLRDVAALAELVYAAKRNNIDVGGSEQLKRYTASRQRDTRRVQQFTHGLIELFTNDYKARALLTNIALGGIELLPPLKRFLLARSMGIHAKQSTLGMGLPLSSRAVATIKPN